MEKLSDYVMEFLVKKGIKDVFFIVGGGNRHLADSLGKNKDLQYVCNHHEQAVSMAVEGYSRIKGFGAGIVTTGPGVTNAITGLYGAWIDSTPCIFISGQVNISQTIGDSGLRQLGVQEVNAISIVKPITKYAVMVKDPKKIKYHLEKAYHLATSRRPGPVWLDIPLNVQKAQIDEHNLQGYIPKETEITKTDEDFKKKVLQSLVLLNKSKRPILYLGQGIRLSKAEKELEELISKLNIPIITSWNGADLIEEKHSLYVGRAGMFGQRPANFAIQNSDLLITIGTRMSISQTGYNFKAFAREAKKIMVDIDLAEMNKLNIKPDISINCDAKEFILETLFQLKDYKAKDISDWKEKINHWKEKYPVVLPEYKYEKDFVNSYVFVDKLSDVLNEKDVITTDMGTSFTGTYQAIKIKKGQRIITSMGMASMGWGLPGAIGVCVGNNRKRTICISGDGGLQINIQELQTLKHYNLPIKLFVINNKGYLTIKEMQKRNFEKFYVGADEESGVSFPDIIEVARAYGLPAYRINNHDELEKIRSIVNMEGPVVCEIMMNPEQPLEPRMISKKGKMGKKYPAPLEEMAPFLPERELKEEMIIPIYEED